MPGHIRPTQNIIRKALFDIIGHDLEGIDFLELFAGSGGVGLEALSNGADSAVMVDRDPKCTDTIRTNMSLFQPENDSQVNDEYNVMEMDAFVAVKFLVKQCRKFHVLFCDPPYEMELAKKVLKTLDAYDILHTNCVVVIEHSKREKLPENTGKFSLVKRRKYGKSFLAVYESKIVK